MATYATSPGGPITVGAAPASGTAQVETATIVGTITGSGTATFTITSAVVAGSPLAVDVDVLVGDTASVVATKAAAKLNQTAAVAAEFVATSNGSGTVILTAIKSAANDATLNIAFTNGTCTGLTPNATSANTTAGVLGEYRGMDKGAAAIDTTNKKVYVNTGTPGVPTWTLQ